MRTRDCRFPRLSRTRAHLRDPAERVQDFEPVEETLTGEEAIAEASRCLTTVTCEACDVCVMICPDLCITRNEQTGRIEIDYDYCKECGLCVAFCPRGAIGME